jgi:hypothetical protein
MDLSKLQIEELEKLHNEYKELVAKKRKEVQIGTGNVFTDSVVVQQLTMYWELSKITEILIKKPNENGN